MDDFGLLVKGAIEQMESINKLLSVACKNRDCINVVMFALEKQLPKKTILKGGGVRMRGNIKICDPPTDYCPNCDESLYYYYGLRYCPKCGQKLDWSEDDDAVDTSY